MRSRSLTVIVLITNLLQAFSAEEGQENVIENIIKRPAPCLGCETNLPTNVVGIDPLIDSAISHIESEREQKYVILKTLKLTRQVVANVRYTLLLQIAPTTCSLYTFSSLTECPVDGNVEPEICEIAFYQKTWNSREKRIISNNCTQSQEFVARSGNNFNPDRYEYADKNNAGQLKEMDEDRWTSLLSQIITEE